VIKLVVMYPQPADPDQFKRHYIERHLLLCQDIPGTLRIQYTFQPKTMAGSEQWFCIYESEYADEAALAAALASSECRRAAEDVPNFSQASPSAIVYEVEEWIWEGKRTRTNAGYV
jgi:uncharacterized protein (TIGR02118 family)